MKQHRLVPSLVIAFSAISFVGCVAGTAREPPEATVHEDAGATPPIVVADARPGGGDSSVPGTGRDDAEPTGGPGYDADPDPVTKPVIETWWPNTFVPGVLPEPSNGRGNHAGSAACGSCHKPGGSAASFAWQMGGIVYDGIGSTTPVASAEIGIKDGLRFFTARSASNGYFWLPGADTIDWSKAEIRIRTAQGDVKMMSAAGSGDCQTCHVAGNRIYPKP